MYNLPHYKEDSIESLLEFMKQNSFAALVGTDSNGMIAVTHIPLLIKKQQDKLFLLGHIMRGTDHHKAFTNNENVLAIFNGPHAYVSASWSENQQQASTWNYTAVHARGKLKFCDDPSLLSMLRKMTALYENDEHSPSLVEKMSEDYLNRMLKAIIGFEIEVTQLENVFKLSQRKSEKDYRNIISQLENRDEFSRQVAELMKQRLPSTDQIRIQNIKSSKKL
jgi:transcriptional regulator